MLLLHCLLLFVECVPLAALQKITLLSIHCSNIQEAKRRRGTGKATGTKEGGDNRDNRKHDRPVKKIGTSPGLSRLEIVGGPSPRPDKEILSCLTISQTKE
jgi:hypothetical protein